MQREPQPSIEYIYSKLIYFPEGQQFTKKIVLLVLWLILICWEWIGGFLLNVRNKKSSQLKEPAT